jgi:hypothetical protein
MTPDQVKELVAEKSSDFVLYVDVASLLLYPDELPVTQHSVFNIIHTRWGLQTCNLSADQLELLSSREIEGIIGRLAGLEGVAAAVCDLQNETANMLASLSLGGCRAQPPQMGQHRQRLAAFFGRLNLAHSVVADLPIYTAGPAGDGVVVDEQMPPPCGMSVAAQRMISFVLGQHLTQVHMCLSHVNRMLGEFHYTPGAGFPLASISAAALHPTPLCPPEAAAICGDEAPKGRADAARRVEPEAPETRAYALSFRERNGLDTNPFSQFTGHS